jgi:hypothetical protein
MNEGDELLVSSSVFTRRLSIGSSCQYCRARLLLLGLGRRVEGVGVALQHRPGHHVTLIGYVLRVPRHHHQLIVILAWHFPPLLMGRLAGIISGVLSSRQVNLALPERLLWSVGLVGRTVVARLLVKVVLGRRVVVYGAAADVCLYAAVFEAALWCPVGAVRRVHVLHERSEVLRAQIASPVLRTISYYDVV